MNIRRLGRPLLIALAVVAVSSAAVFGALYVREQETHPAEVSAFLEGQRGDVEVRARQVLDLIVNFDATNIEDRRRELLKIATGTFREQYEEAFQSLGESLQNVSVSSRGEIVEGPSVSFHSATEAIALARITETIQSNEDPQGITFLNEIKLTLVLTAEGEWKADRAEILSTERV